MEISKHRTIMMKILIDIYKNNILSNKLGFKGGTACYFFYDLPRFSVDLDFNLLKIEILENDDLEKIIKVLTKIISKYGYIEQSSTKLNTLFWLLKYEKEQWNLKIEVSTRNYSDDFEIKELLGIGISVMKKEYMFAHKLVALTDRKNPVARDVFDIDYFLKQEWKISRRIIEERTGKKPKDYLKLLPSFVEKNFSNKNILNGVGELLDESQRDHYKVKLLSDVVVGLKILAENSEAYLV